MKYETIERLTYTGYQDFLQDLGSLKITFRRFLKIEKYMDREHKEELKKKLVLLKERLVDNPVMFKGVEHKELPKQLNDILNHFEREALNDLPF